MSSTTRSRTGGIDGFFQISERGSTVGREVRGGVVTFFTMAYIIVLNPLILGRRRQRREVPRRRQRAGLRPGRGCHRAGGRRDDDR